jgi:hypothetical protein
MYLRFNGSEHDLLKTRGTRSKPAIPVKKEVGVSEEVSPSEESFQASAHVETGISAQCPSRYRLRGPPDRA